MASRSFFVELKVNFDDKLRAEKENLLKGLIVAMARVIRAKAMLISDRSEPKLSIVMQDSVGEHKRISLNDYPEDDGVCPCCGHEREIL